jgi:hypothetical protein
VIDAEGGGAGHGIGGWFDGSFVARFVSCGDISQVNARYLSTKTKWRASKHRPQVNSSLEQKRDGMLMSSIASLIAEAS